MKKRYLIGIFLLVMLAGCGAQKSSKKNNHPETTAEYVQQASFTTFAGDSVDVADFKGKVVMIDFWETWCKPCVSSFPGIQRLVKEYPDDFVALAVTPGFNNTKAQAKKFADNHSYDFTYLMDSNNLHKKLNVRGIPFKAFVGADGHFIKTSMGSAGPTGDYQRIKKIIEAHKQKAP